MARIGSYPIDVVIEDKDAWIGTQSTNRVTRQFTALGVANYIDTKNVGLVFVGATNLLDGAKGLVPAPTAGQEGMYLKGDLNGGWTTIPVYTLDVPQGTTNVNLINTDGAGIVTNSFITLTGGTYLTAVHTDDAQITFNHDDTTRTDTVSASSPAAGEAVALVSSITSNATGHIEAVNIETVTWPADSDTTYTIDIPNATTSINLAGSDGTNDPIAFTTLATAAPNSNGMTITRTDADNLDFYSIWQQNTRLVEGYVPKGEANANKFWATDANGNPGWTFQPSQDQVITSVGSSNITTGIELSQNGQTVFIRGAGTITASSDNTNGIITLTGTDQNTIYTLPVAAGAANSAVINLTDNAASVVSAVTFNGTPTGIAISETVGNNGSITIGLQPDITVTGAISVTGGNAAAGTGRSSFVSQVTIPQTPLVGTDAASKAYVDGLVAGGLTFIGTFRADTGEILSGANSSLFLYNCPGGAGTRVAVAVGDYYIVATAAGSFYCSGVTLDIGDSIIATTAAAADASVVGEWSVVQSDEGVATFTNVNGTFVSASTVNTDAAGAVTMGTIDLSAGGLSGTPADAATQFLRGDNTWNIPAGTYALPVATLADLGGVKLGSSTALTETYETGGVGASGQTYPVQLNAANQAGVSVPWTNLVTSVSAEGAASALSGLTSTPTTGAVVIGLDINGRASLGVPVGGDELMIYDASTTKNVKVRVDDLAQYVGDGTAVANQVTYWTSANNIGGGTGFTYAGGATGAITMGGALTTGGAVRINGTTTTGLVIASSSASSNGLKLYNDSANDNAYIYNHFDGNLEIGTNNATVLTITNIGVTFSNLSNTSAASSSVDEVKIGSFGAGRPAIYFGTSNTTYTNSTWFMENVGASGKFRIGRNGLDIIEISNAGNTTFAGDIMPSAENLYDIGSASVRWEDIWADQVYGRSVYVDDNIYHNGDTDTYIAFAADRQTYSAGGDEFIDFREATESYITLGNSNDTDTRMQGGAGYIFIQGSNGYIGINDATPSYPFEVNANTFIGGTLEVSSTVKSSTYLINLASAAGIGASLGDINGAELGPGYLTVSRDDTANAKQISFYKNNVEHSYLETTSSGLNIGGAFVTITNNPTTTDATLSLKRLSNAVAINDNIGYLNFLSNDASTSSSGGVGGIGVYAEAAFNTSHTPSYMSFYTHATTTNDGTNIGNVTERMRIDSSGNMTLLNATATNSKSIGITNSAGTTGWTFGNGVLSNTHQFVIYDNTAGSSRMLIDSSGNVGINEPTPTAKLQVNGQLKIGSGGGSGTDSGSITTQVNSFTFGATGETGLLIRNDGQTSEYATIGFGYSENNRTPVVIGGVISDGGGATAGEFVIGTRNSTTNTVYPTIRLKVTQTGNTLLYNSLIFSDSGYVSDYSIRRNANAIIFSGGSDGYFFNRYDNSVTDMWISGDGITRIGGTSNLGYPAAHNIQSSAASGYALIVRNSDTSTTNGSVMQFNRAETTATTGGYCTIYRQGSTTTGTNRWIVYANGDITNTNNSYGSISDERKKENIVDATPKLDKLMDVKVRNFNLIGEETKQIGVVAQELEEIFPGMISESKDPDSGDETLYKSVKYSVFVPMLIKSIQEQQTMLKELKAEIEILKNK